MAYAIRLTPRDESDEQKLKVILDKIGGAHVACREYATSMHIHVVLWTSKTPVEVRNAFYNNMGKTGNGVLSIKQAKDDKGAMRYCCKGDSEHPSPRGNPPDVVFHYGHTVYSTPVLAWEAYWQTSAEIKKTPGLSFATQVEYAMVQNQVPFTKENVIDTVLQMTLDKKNQVNEYYMVGVAKLVLAKNNRVYKTELREQLLRKLDI